MYDLQIICEAERDYLGKIVVDCCFVFAVRVDHLRVETGQRQNTQQPVIDICIIFRVCYKIFFDCCLDPQTLITQSTILWVT